MNNKLIYVFTLLISVIIIFTICTTIITNDAIETSSQKIYSKPTIIIDPGHGGEDGGAVVNNVYEKDINLSISLKLKELLSLTGYDVYMTRNTDKSLSDNGINKKKYSDLNNRVKTFNSSSNNIVISIHQNKFQQSQYYGTQVFYSKNNTKSEILAESIQNSVVRLLQKDNSRQIKQSGSEIFILDNAHVPAVLIECGFLSNDIELKKLQNEKYQKEMAYAIYLGILEYQYINY